MTRRITFATAPAHQRDMETWPTCDMSQLSEVQAGHIERRAKALKAYLINGKLKPAAALGGCSASVLLNSLTRCLTIAADGKIFGLRALLPRGRTKEYGRTKALPKGRQRASLGASGSFAALLNQHPDIRANLDSCIERGGSRHLTSSKPRAIDVYRTFIQFCRTRVEPDCYPLNSSSSARRSVERYVRSYLEQNTSCVKTWSGQDAAQRLRLGTGYKSFVLGEVPFDEVAFDAHQIHCIGIVEIPGPVGPQRVSIERLWLNVLLDAGCSRAVLGYSIGIATQISSSHVGQAIKSSSSPWKPLIPHAHIAGVSYKDGAGLPVGSISGLTACRFAKLKMDNAAQHFSNRIVNDIRHSMGCTISWGQVGGWWRNSEVERFFGTLEGRGFQSLPSSTGSNSRDPLKVDPVGQALLKGIGWDDLIYLADVFIANYNATPHSALGGQTPLDVLRRHLDPESRSFVLRPSVPITALSPHLGVDIETRYIRGSLRNGCRPYVELDEIRYSGEDLLGRFDLVGTAIIVHVDASDMRSIVTYTEDGRLIGELRPLKTVWREKKISRDLVKKINAHVRNASNVVGRVDDPVNSYFGELVRKTSEAGKRAPKKVSRDATRLAAAAYDSGTRICDMPMVGERARPAAVRPLPPSVPAPRWDTEPET